MSFERALLLLVLRVLVLELEHGEGRLAPVLAAAAAVGLMSYGLGGGCPCPQDPPVALLLLLLHWMMMPSSSVAVKTSSPPPSLVLGRSLHALQQELEALCAVQTLVAAAVALPGLSLLAGVALGGLEQGDVAGDDGAAELLQHVQAF